MFNRKLPVPLNLNEIIYNQIELETPGGEELSEINEQLKNQPNTYLGIRNFVAASTKRIFNDSENEIKNSSAIKSALAKMSNKNLEYFAQEIMINFYDGEDFVEGVYPCPRCGTPEITELKKDGGIEIDTRDRISNLPVNFMDDLDQATIEISLDNPLELSTLNSKEIVSNFTLRLPICEDYIKAYLKYGDKKEVRFQFAVYAEAITHVNGAAIDKDWTKKFGLMLFLKLKEGFNKKQKEISSFINKWGVDPRTEKECKKCCKVWQPFVETSNFFDFAQQ